MNKIFFPKSSNGKSNENPPTKNDDLDELGIKQKRTAKKDTVAEKLENATIEAPKSQIYQKDSFVKILESEDFQVKKVQLSIEKDAKAPFFIIADTFDFVAQISGKNSQERKKEAISRLFDVVLEYFPNEIIGIYYFCILRTNTEWLQKDLGIGNEILVKAIVTATGRTGTLIKTNFREKGCFGTVLESSKGEQNTIGTFFGVKKTKTDKETPKNTFEKITFEWIFEHIKLIGTIVGTKSTQEKENILVKLFRAASPVESKYICRFIGKNYKIGVAEKFFQSALARAFSQFFKRKGYQVFSNLSEKADNESLCGFWEENLQRILTQFPDHGTVISSLMSTHSLPKTGEICKLTPGIPCKPMLAKPTKSLAQVFSRFDNRKFTCEYKYDGLRGQIHYDKEREILKIYSRNLEDMTLQYPDIALSVAEFVQDKNLIEKIKYFSGIQKSKTPEKEDEEIKMEIEESEKINSFIIDSEIVAYDKSKNKILPFQVLATRARKNVSLQDDQVSVCIFIFDVLYFNGKPLINQQFVERRKVIREKIDPYSVNCKKGIIKPANYADCDDINALQLYLENSIKDGCEGLMVKTIEENATYEPAKRSFKWLKVKKDYLDNQGIGDSLDLVVVGANYGAGKRAGKYGTYLMACYNPNSGAYETAALVGTGFTDSQLDEFYEVFKNKEIKEKPKDTLIEKSGYPDVWLDPELVFEIKAADIQISPVYKSAKSELKDELGKGLGLRFPRFVRWRKDKNPISATDSRFIYEIYKAQALIQNKDFSDDDYY